MGILVASDARTRLCTSTTLENIHAFCANQNHSGDIFARPTVARKLVIHMAFCSLERLPGKSSKES
jgi:hypothetical protein